MKRLPLTSALLALTVIITACGDPVPTPTTADLTLKLNNVASARVKVTNAAGEIKFDESVTGSKVLSALPTGKYTVTGSNTPTFAAPAPQTLDLTASTTATLDYTALKGSLTLTVEGVPGARVVVKDAAGKAVFADTVTGSKALADLPYGEYTVTPEKVEGQITPAAQTVSVGANSSVTLTYSTTALPKATLTLTVNGVPSATVQVKQGDTVLFDGPVTASKTLSDLPRSSVTVIGGAVGGHTTPSTQTVDLGSGSGSASLNYAAVIEPKPPVVVLDPARLKGTITGWDGGTGVVSGIGSIPASGIIDLALPVPDLRSPFFRKTLLGCTFISSNNNAQFLEKDYFELDSVTGGFLGSLIESAAPTLPTSNATSYSSYAQVYSTAATALSGSVACGNNQTATSTLTLQTGWNLVFVSVTPSGLQVSNRTGQPYYLLFQAAPKALNVSTGSLLPVQLPKKTLDINLSAFPRGRSEGDYSLTLEGAPAGTTLSETALKVAGNTNKAVTLTLPEGVKAGKIDATLVLKGPAGTVRTPLSFTVQAAIPTPILTLDSGSLSLTPGGATTIKGRVRSSVGTTSSIYTSLAGDIADLSLNTDSLSNITEAGQDVTFNLSASTNAKAGERNLEIVLNSTNGAEQVKVPVKINVLSSGFILYLDSSEFSVYPGESVNVPVTISSFNGFAGTVNLTVTDLPQGVTTQVKTVNLTGSSLSTNLVLSGASSAPVLTTGITVVAQNGEIKAQQRASITVYPVSIKVPGVIIVNGVIKNSVDGAGNVWLGGDQGFLRVKPDLSLDTVNSTKPPCGLTVGQDGGIWMATEPYTRFDPASGVLENYASPRGFSGCAGSYQFDAKRRSWETYFGLYRLDLINQKSEKVPGTDNLNGPVKVRGTVAWVSTYSNELFSVDTDTLVLTKYSLPGASILSGDFYPLSGKIHFVDSQQLAAFDPASGTVNRADTGAWRINILHGLDNSGNAWVSATRYDGGYRQAILRLNASGAVLKELPALSGTFAASPTGGLWFTNNNYANPRVAYIAP